MLPVSAEPAIACEGVLREVVETLAPLDRTPCSPGEREAAEWLARACARSRASRSRSRTSPRWGTFPPTATGLGAARHGRRPRSPARPRGARRRARGRAASRASSTRRRTGRACCGAWCAAAAHDRQRRRSQRATRTAERRRWSCSPTTTRPDRAASSTRRCSSAPGERDPAADGARQDARCRSGGSGSPAPPCAAARRRVERAARLGRAPASPSAPLGTALVADMWRSRRPCRAPTTTSRAWPRSSRWPSCCAERRAPGCACCSSPAAPRRRCRTASAAFVARHRDALRARAHHVREPRHGRLAPPDHARGRGADLDGATTPARGSATWSPRRAERARRSPLQRGFAPAPRPTA